MTEEQLEELCLDWFHEKGWEIFFSINSKNIKRLDCFRKKGWEIWYGLDIEPESKNPMRSDYRQVILESHLRTAFEHINQDTIPSHEMENCYEQVKATILRPESPDLVTNNRTFHRLLLEGIPVKYKIDDTVMDEHAFLIDFDQVENNRFVAVNQFTVSGTRQARRADIVCFINGLPIAVLELKSPSDENVDIWSAFNQLQTYKDELADLFIFNEALVISDGFNARMGSLTAHEERFMFWRTIKDEEDKPELEFELETMVRGFFDRELLLDYIRSCIFFETDDETLSSIRKCNFPGKGNLLVYLDTFRKKIAPTKNSGLINPDTEVTCV